MNNVKRKLNSMVDVARHAVDRLNDQSRHPWTRTILIGLGVALLVAILKIISDVWRDLTRRKRLAKLTQIDRARFKTPSDESIFVCLTSTGEAHVGDMIFELFKQAYCPTRVTVGIIQHLHHTHSEEDRAGQGHDPDDPVMLAVDAVVRYQHLCRKDGTMPDFSQNIRKLNLPSSDARGRLPARHTVFKQLYKHEKFICHVDVHCKMTKSWDATLIDQWQYANQYSKQPIVTCEPPTVADLDAHIQHLYTMSKKAQETMIDQIHTVKDLNLLDRLSDWNLSRLRQKSDLDVYQYPNAVPGTWHRMLSWNTLNLPKCQKLFFTSYHKKIHHPIPTYWYCSRLSFGLAEAFLAMPSDPRLYFTRLSDGIDFIDTLRLWTSGCDFFNPSHLVAVDYWMHRQSGLVAHRDYVQAASEFWQDHRPQVESIIQRYLEVRPVDMPSRNLSDHDMVDSIMEDALKITWIMHGEQRHIADYIVESGINWVDHTVSMYAAKGLYQIHHKIPIESIVFIKYGSWKEYRRRRHVKHMIDPDNRMPDDERWMLEDHEHEQLKDQQHYFDLSSSFRSRVKFEEFYPHE